MGSASQGIESQQIATCAIAWAGRWKRSRDGKETGEGGDGTAAQWSCGPLRCLGLYQFAEQVQQHHFVDGAGDGAGCAGIGDHHSQTLSAGDRHVRAATSASRFVFDRYGRGTVERPLCTPGLGYRRYEPVPRQSCPVLPLARDGSTAFSVAHAYRFLTQRQRARPHRECFFCSPSAHSVRCEASTGGAT